MSQIWDWHTCCHKGSLPISQHVSTCENRSKSGWSTLTIVQANEPSSMWAVADPLLVLKPLFCWCHFHAQRYGDVPVSAGCPGHTRHFPDCTPHFCRSCHTRHRITHHMASYHIIVPLLQLTSPILDAPKVHGRRSGNLEEIWSFDKFEILCWLFNKGGYWTLSGLLGWLMFTVTTHYPFYTPLMG